MFITGSGIPIVVIPGLQGRWEWMRPAVDALARHHRVITFSLCDERTSPFPCDPAMAFENFVSQVDLVLDRAGLDRAVIAGVSYGGLIAAEYAARRPERVSALVLASALHSSWEPDARQQSYLDAPDSEKPAVRGHGSAADAARTSRRHALDGRTTAFQRRAWRARVLVADDAGADGSTNRLGKITSFRRSASRQGARTRRHW